MPCLPCSVETATQTLHRLTSYQPGRDWDEAIDDPRIVQDLEANDMSRLPPTHAFHDREQFGANSAQNCSRSWFRRGVVACSCSVMHILATMSKVLCSLPVGERVGIAFSGGLDT